MAKIDFAGAWDMIRHVPGAIVLDVREEEEYLTGHIEGALLYPVDTIDADSAARRLPDRSAPILVYCKSGRRSLQAAQTLMRLGYTNVYDIGSLVGWPYGLSWG